MLKIYTQMRNSETDARLEERERAVDGTTKQHIRERADQENRYKLSQKIADCVLRRVRSWIFKCSTPRTENYVFVNPIAEK